MKQFLFLLIGFLTLLFEPPGLAQSTITFPRSGKVATEAYVDSVVKANRTSIGNIPVTTPPIVVTPPVVVDQVPILKPCDAGPEIRTITNITTSSLSAVFHGQNVFGITFQILSGSTVQRSGTIEPKSNTLPLTFDALPPGSYTLRLFGSTCQGMSSREFTIPIKETGAVTPAPVLTPNQQSKGNYELFMNLTGFGYEPTAPNGLHHDWPERIEAFRYEWGYGITGIRLNIRWNEWEPTPDNFTRQGLQKIIVYCRERGLKLSVLFWPWRKQGDNFIPEGHYVTGHRGKQHQFDGNTRMGSLASDVVNAKIYNAVQELSRELNTYEGAYYLSIGTATAEEFTNPVIGEGLGGPKEITGFEPVFQDGFRAFRQAKNRPYERPIISEWDGGAGLEMGNEAGKDFARFISLTLTRYFDNFTRAVKDGSGGKVLSVYSYPDAGSPQNAWYLHANFASQARTADGMFGTDGNDRWDNSRKLLVNAVNLGMGKISMNEYDPFDLSSDGYCTGINLGQLEREFEKSYSNGVQVIHLSMSYCPAEIRGMEPHLRYLSEKYIGKPYVRPNRPVTEVSITPAYWQGQEIFAPHWTGNNFLKPVDDEFWGASGRN
ncbi:hypothetical protein [Arundinibacter roseus]|uniref:Glycoside hydrolase family 42 N-terminal domain-containing protein n=1 Tax=Arundinibacter roseus TaxID=2070510 RepID=A0A4R4KCC3_9BACT|nr:hypothetical protein [Arundinibacter roseus]TDB64422.1 hypothetical protein EZE20_12115 [Arundinibacter roseus]